VSLLTEALAGLHGTSLDRFTIAPSASEGPTGGSWPTIMLPRFFRYPSAKPRLLLLKDDATRRPSP
jgi:hypothetical protein